MNRKAAALALSIGALAARADAVDYIKPSSPQGGENFGRALALSADGLTLAAGAPRFDDPQYSGRVHVFVRRDFGGEWQREAVLAASNIDELDQFGSDVALSADGSTLAVSAIKEDSSATGVNGNQNSNASTDSGAVYVFVRRANELAPSAGAAYVYTRDSAGTLRPRAFLKASNPEFLRRDEFGTRVAMSADALTVAVGTPNEDSGATGIDGDQFNNTAVDSGAVYVFANFGGQWNQSAYVKATHTASYDLFGAVLCLSGDGQTLAVSAWSDNSGTRGINGEPEDDPRPDSGAVYVY